MAGKLKTFVVSLLKELSHNTVTTHLLETKFSHVNLKEFITFDDKYCLGYLASSTASVATPSNSFAETRDYPYYFAYVRGSSSADYSEF